MTTNAIIQGFKICQANLGVKIHDVKDPSKYLGPMFRQVLWILLTLMEQYEEYWKLVQGSQPVEILGQIESREPDPVEVTLPDLIYRFKVGFKQFSPLWKEMFSEEAFSAVERAARLSPAEFSFPVESWVKILYELAATFHAWPRNRFKIVELVTPLYYARIADFVRATWDMTSEQSEQVVEQQAQTFENDKGYLLKVWQEKSRIPQNFSGDWQIYE
jgi:hypothetical protein